VEPAGRTDVGGRDVWIDDCTFLVGGVRSSLVRDLREAAVRIAGRAPRALGVRVVPVLVLAGRGTRSFGDRLDRLVVLGPDHVSGWLARRAHGSARLSTRGIAGDLCTPPSTDDGIVIAPKQSQTREAMTGIVRSESARGVRVRNIIEMALIAAVLAPLLVAAGLSLGVPG
jgi:hypothetical protein